MRKMQETYEADYYNLEDRMRVLRKRNSFLEVNLGKANKISDDAKKTVEMKEEECKLMASIIHSSRTNSATTFAPQFDSQGAPRPSPGSSYSPQGSALGADLSPVALFKRRPFASHERQGTRVQAGAKEKAIEDELAELVCSPDSLDSQEEEDDD